jgi:hypothetical protein
MPSDKYMRLVGGTKALALADKFALELQEACIASWCDGWADKDFPCENVFEFSDGSGLRVYLVLGKLKEGIKQ